MAAVQQTLPMRGLEYPKQRPAFFALKFLRLLMKACAAQDIGVEGIAFLSAVVLREDSRRYQSAVTFYNSQLIDHLGLQCWDTLDGIRKRCVAHGWLHYERGGKRKPGIYWVLIPEHAVELDESLGEDVASYFGVSSGETGTKPVPPENIGWNTGTTSGETPDDRREEHRTNTGTSLPFPNPDPSPTPNAAGGGGDLDSADTASRSEPAGGETAVRAAVTELLTQERLSAALRADASGQRCLSRAGDTANRALAVGHSIDTVRAVVVHVIDHPEFWGAGALRIRLTDPDCVRLAASEGWPEPDGKAKAAWQTAQQQVRQQQAAQVDAQQRAAAADELQSELQQLEFNFGDQVDRLTDDELADVLTVNAFALRKFRQSGREAVPRATLLRAFAAVAATN